MRTMDPGYPKPITIWKGIPDSPQGAFVDKANGSFEHFVRHVDINQKTQSNILKYCRDLVWLNMFLSCMCSYHF